MLTNPEILMFAGALVAPFLVIAIVVWRMTR